MNILKFGYGINYKHEGQLSYSIDRFYVAAKFQFPKLNDISKIFRRIPVDYKKGDYLSLHNSLKYAHL